MTPEEVRRLIDERGGVWHLFERWAAPAKRKNLRMTKKKAMTKKEALREFNELCPRESFVTLSSNGRKALDKPMRDQAWNDFTDALCKDGRITASQYANWHHPFN